MESTPDDASEMEEELVEAFKLFATGGDELSGANGEAVGGLWRCVGGWVGGEGGSQKTLLFFGVCPVGRLFPSLGL